MTESRFQAAVLGVGAAWRLFAVRPGLDLAAWVYGIGFGILPYAALAVLAMWIRARRVLVAAAVAALALDVVAYVLAVTSGDAMGGVLVMLVPLVSLVTIMPAVALLGWVLRR